MVLLKYVVLCLLLWNIPTFFSYDISIGSKFSYFLYVLLGTYYFLVDKKRILTLFLIFVLLYFIISGLNYVQDPKFYYADFIKFIILILSGTELARNTSIKQFYIILIFGAISILFHATFFPDGYGRYSGFYLDPNGASFICLIGFCLSFAIKSKSLKVLGQVLFTFTGIITFSRTFILLWLLTSIAAVFSHRKNSMNLGLGLGAIIAVFSLASVLKLNVVRFSALESIISNDLNKSNIAVLEEDSRTETWSVYYDMILNNPIFGNGYQQLSGSDHTKQGVHNSFLMVLGEAGIIPFLLMSGIYIFMLTESLRFFKNKLHYFLIALSLVGILMTMHNFFSSYVIVFTTLWLYVRITEDDLKNEFEEIS